MEIDKIILNTTSQEGQSIQTTANLGDINFSSVLQEAPQIQTTIQDNIATISSIVNAPWVNVTSVNGMTGDIIVEPEILDFKTNHYYPKNTLISYNGNLYWAKQNFNSDSSFNRNDWNQIEATGVSDWADIQNKPNFATVATSGSYTDLSNTPNLAIVATTGEYSDLLHTPSLSQVATSGSYNDLSNTPTLATVASSGQYSDLSGKPTNVSHFTNDVNYLRGVDSQTITGITSVISTSMIQNQAITKDKINWTEIINNSADGKYLLVKDNGSYSFERQSEWQNGEVLCVTNNTATLSGNWNSPAIWTAGTWSQYGRLATTTTPYCLTISNPTEYDWYVLFQIDSNNVNVPSGSWASLGICELDNNKGWMRMLAQALMSFNNGTEAGFASLVARRLVRVPANTTRYCAPFVAVSGSGNAQYKAGDVHNPQTSNSSFGGVSCTFSATLVSNGVS